MFELKLLSLFANNIDEGIFGIFFVVDFLEVSINNGNEVRGNWLFVVNASKHFQKLLIRNEAISRESCSFLFQKLIKSFLDLVHGYIDFSYLFHGASAAVGSQSFITHFSVERYTIGCKYFDDLFPLQLPTRKLLAFLRQQF